MFGVRVCFRIRATVGRLWLQPLWITLPVAAGCCHYCVVHAKLDFVGLSVFGLNYVAALCAGVETTVRMLMVNSCDSVGTRSRVSGSAIFAGSGQVMGQCDRPGFVAFARFTVAFGETLRHL